MEITLIRHGKPKFELKGKARSREISEIIINYDLSGITGEPPTDAKEKALTCSKAYCPVCNEVIGKYTVKNRFTCPSCKAILNSNKKEVLNTAAIIGVALYIILFLVIILVTMSLWPKVAVVTAGSIAPIIVYYSYFKIKFRLTNEKSKL